jgi:hypothetical protein
MPFVILPTNSASGGYEITNSLRFESGSSDYLVRTPASSGNRQIWTWSCWLKKTKLSTRQNFFQGGNHNTGSNSSYFEFSSGDVLRIAEYDGSVETYNIDTTQVFRDVSAFYHIVIAFDTTQATASNRVKLYINGTQVTSFSTSNYPSQNYNTSVNHTLLHNIGRDPSGGFAINGYMSDVFLIDGQALTPSSFGETDFDTGIWKPKAYTGTYGTNGFYLQFKNSASLGTDSSGNSNTFTVNNLTSVDQSTDTPTNNFCTLNPLDIKNPSYVNTLTEGNLTAYKPEGDGSWFTSFATFSPAKGKWYWEVKPTNLTTTLALGIYFGQNTFTTAYPFDANVFYCHQNGLIYYNGNSYSYMASYTSNDIVTFALDMDNGKFYMGKNGSWANGTGSTNQTFANAVSITDDIPASFPTGKDVFPIATVRDAYGNFNFGSPPYSANSYTDGAGYGNFSYAVPSGYYSLNTRNLATFG